MFETRQKEQLIDGNIDEAQQQEPGQIAAVELAQGTAVEVHPQGKGRDGKAGSQENYESGIDVGCETFAYQMRARCNELLQEKNNINVHRCLNRAVSGRMCP